MLYSSEVRELRCIKKMYEALLDISYTLMIVPHHMIDNMKYAILNNAKLNIFQYLYPERNSMKQWFLYAKYWVSPQYLSHSSDFLCLKAKIIPSQHMAVLLSKLLVSHSLDLIMAKLILTNDKLTTWNCEKPIRE